MVRIARARSLAAWHAELGGALLASPRAVELPLESVASLAHPASGALAFCRTVGHVRQALAAALARPGVACAVLLVPEEARELAEEHARQSVRDARIAPAIWVHDAPIWVVANLLITAAPAPEPVIDPSANVHKTAVVYDGVEVGPRVYIGPYCVIGQPGFGWARGPASARGALRIPHAGGVRIGAGAHLASHVTVDAGMIDATVIGEGAMLDSHVHIGHNARVGRGAVLCAQVGLAGSVDVGDGVEIGGQAGVADHVCIGAGARIAGKSGVIGDVPAGATFAGYPAMPRVRWLRGLAQWFKAPEAPRAKTPREDVS